MIERNGLKKFQVTLSFSMDNGFMSQIPAHRAYINELIEDESIDQYLVSLEAQKLWITVTAAGKEEVMQILHGTPLFPYFSEICVETIYIVDGLHYRFPALQPN